MIALPNINPKSLTRAVTVIGCNMLRNAKGKNISAINAVVNIKKEENTPPYLLWSTSCFKLCVDYLVMKPR